MQGKASGIVAVSFNAGILAAGRGADGVRNCTARGSSLWIQRQRDGRHAHGTAHDGSVQRPASSTPFIQQPEYEHAKKDLLTLLRCFGSSFVALGGDVSAVPGEWSRLNRMVMRSAVLASSHASVCRAVLALLLFTSSSDHYNVLLLEALVPSCGYGSWIMDVAPVRPPQRCGPGRARAPVGREPWRCETAGIQTGISHVVPTLSYFRVWGRGSSGGVSR